MSPLTFDFHDKVALVTGGASGIGKATALAFAGAGATVVIAGRRSEEGEATVDEVRALGVPAKFICTDIAKFQEVAALHTAVLDSFGRLDIAFNNAGYQEPRALVAEQGMEEYDRVFDTNLRGTYQALQHQLQIMERQGSGVIIVNASVSGLRNPNPGLALYSASKAALISLTRSAAMEYAEKGIRVNAVAPGRVVTEMMLNSNIMDMQIVAEGLPIRRMGKPDEVANAVLWLASDAASFVVGHVLCTDGGFMTT